ncbi:MAG: hypothetical protein KXJ49_00500 [Vulcanococcus sp.]|uniref:hypothetical protein n=1 Tax=Vulcanococcus sp. TaxID=2856995 RepID=UPI0025CF6ADE|nr:hypothetical protein [Vulcanococcus sp.]MBW0165961.1 hypothetical protein [Vulcanococcus sp.]
MSVTQFDTYRALNQLASLVVGRDRAIETNDLESDPIARIKKLKLLVDQDFRQANELGDTKTVKQVERTMASLQSLLTLAELADEVEW